MTPAEQRLMNEMIREAVRPLEQEIQRLKGADSRHSIRIKAVSEQDIPKLRDVVKSERVDDMTAVAAAYEKLVHVVNDMADAQALILDNQRRAEERAKKTLVVVEDGQGSATMQPASVVAVGQNKAIAIDTEATASDMRHLTRWQKIGLPIIGLIPVAIEAWHLIFPSVPK